MTFTLEVRIVLRRLRMATFRLTIRKEHSPGGGVGHCRCLILLTNASKGSITHSDFTGYH
jgi:hypothetical protein